jgi:hypothetical protein
VKNVAIAVAPLDARVFRGDEDLGQSPVVVEVGEEPVALSVRAEGYVTRELSIDGSQSKVSIELEEVPKKAVARPRPAGAPRPSTTAAPRPSPQPRAGGSELVDPWD